MQRGATEPPAQWWESELLIDEPSVHYRFIIDAADGIWHYSAAGLSAHVPLDRTDFRILADYDPPGWPLETVFYQIFPDRFANGDPSTDPRPEEYEYRGHRPMTYPWETPPPPDQLGPLVFYGGDLPGIESHLEYLADLGVNALYLNPVFTALSNHKYDVADYRPCRSPPRRRRRPGLAAAGARRARHALSARHRTQPLRLLAPLVPGRSGRRRRAGGRVLHLQQTSRRLRQLAGRMVAAQAQLSQP
jgi:hypothetical protein